MENGLKIQFFCGESAKPEQKESIGGTTHNDTQMD
jgi:hypothetical protein